MSFYELVSAARAALPTNSESGVRKVRSADVGDVFVDSLGRRRFKGCLSSGHRTTSVIRACRQGSSVVATDVDCCFGIVTLPHVESFS